ncbi:MAG: tetratricopeptide repeat protein [Chthoniobacter sp.]
MKSVFPLAGLIVLAFVPLRGADFQGADEALKKIIAQHTKVSDEKKADPVEELRKKLLEYRAQAAELAPEEAATRWMGLFDAFSALPASAINQSQPWEERLSVTTFLESLPPSNAWEALARRLDAKVADDQNLRPYGLHILAALLRDDAAGRDRAMHDLRVKIEHARPGELAMDAQFLESMEEGLETLDGEDKQLASFEARLTRMEGHGNRYQNGAIRVPALLKRVGEDKARALLQRVFALGVGVETTDKDTRRLAVRVATESADQLKSPVWSLVQEMDDAPLYEALAKRFPKTNSENDYNRAPASAVYLVALIAQHRTKEAAELLAEMSKNPVGTPSFVQHGTTDYLVRQGLVRQVSDFFREVLSGDPALPYWEPYIQLSARLGEPDRALAFLREVGARPNLSPAAREQTDRFYLTALLAADDIDSGIKVLRETIQKSVPARRGDAAAEISKSYANAQVNLPPEAVVRLAQMSRNSSDRTREHVEDCLHLVRLGRLLERPELVDEGLAAALVDLANANPSSARGTTDLVLEFLIRIGRGAEAEKLVSESPLMNGENEQEQLGNVTEQLAAIYHLAGREGDVLKIIEQSPYWNVVDLSDLRGSEKLNVPILYMAAKALATAGRKEEARRIVNRLVEIQSGYDPGYALLLELGGDGVEKRLDELAQRDRFQERPLIWKAKLQGDAGRLEEAEKSARAAIAIDPSDGEEGKGDRMRAYAVLGDILEKKGDAAQAKIIRGAVEAIRLSENADDWWEAGLLRRAVKMYEEALEHFADAYCIQSRLALRYSELGDLARAEQHYQRAFELMPESFGRIESHCFGCEGAFASERAQNVAERVFTQLAASPAARPQVFYLLGYLRQEQGRAAEAAAEFSKAVKLDPDYFNAWEHLTEVGGEGILPAAEMDAATLAMLRLDPTMIHHSGTLGGVRDLRVYWDAILAAEKAQPKLERGPLWRCRRWWPSGRAAGRQPNRKARRAWLKCSR